MAAPPASRGRRVWHWCRCSFRWCRIAALGTVLLFLVLLTWLRVAGLPDFVRRRIILELAHRGVSANFESLRFQWFRGFVAENLRVSWGGAQGPKIRLEEVDLDIAPPPWRAKQDIVRGLSVLRGDLVIPVRLTNEPDTEIRVDGIAADLRFLPGDTWEIRRLAARLAGLQIEMRVRLDHVAALRTPTNQVPIDPAARAQRLRLLKSALDEVAKWSAPEPLRLDVGLQVDGRSPWSSHGDIYLEVPEVHTPRGDLRQLRLSLRAHPATEADPLPRSTAILELGEIQTPDGGASQIAGRLELNGPPRPALPTNATWSLSLDHLFVRGFRARNIEINGTNVTLAQPAGVRREDLAETPVRSAITLAAGHIEAAQLQGVPISATQTVVRLAARHTLSSAPPEQATVDVRVEHLGGAPGSIGSLKLDAQAVRIAAPTPVPPDLGPWAWLWPLSAQIQASIQGVESSSVMLDHLETTARWDPPHLTVPRLDAALYGGKLHATADLDVVSRLARASAETTFDLHAADPFLGPKSRENFARYQWTHAPWFQGSAQATLPPWTLRKPDWNALVKPTVRLEGRFRVDAGSFKGVPFDHAESSLSYDGDTWRLPDIRTRRPEGNQEIAVEYHEESREYRVDASGHVHPPVLKPILGEHTAEILDLFQFREAIGATVSVWGPWTEGTSQSIAGRVHATNFVFRNQRFDRLDGTMLYTNHVLVGAPVQLSRDAGELRVEGVGYDFVSDLLTLTNAINTIDPAVVAAAISSNFPARIAPYRFDTPPRVVVNGRLYPKETASADLAFDIAGGPFHFWKLSASQIQSTLLWTGNFLRVTNIQAGFYQGSLEGHVEFDLTDPTNGMYGFVARARDAQLGDLLHEATPGRDKVAQGTFDLDLNVTSARISDLKSWHGFGRADLREGLLWDAPIFGFVSPALNAIVPGIGNNRAKRAEATFTITNSVFSTRDLSIACPPAKLLYRGSLDFDQNVDAKVEAQVLGEVLGVGPLFGLLLRPLTKLMEFRVTGTLADVKAEPLYIPKVLLLPLQPVRMLFNIFGNGDSKNDRAEPHDLPATPGTNAPPVPRTNPDPP